MSVSRAALSPRRPVPAPERPRHLELVPGRPASGRRPPTAFAILTMMLTGAALFALVFAQVLLGQAGIRESKLQREVTEKQTVVDQLALDVQRLRAPARIAAAAVKIGMVPATDVTVIDASSVSVRPSTVRGPSPKRGRP